MIVEMTIIDYTLLISTLLVSLGIGFYYALFKKQNTADEYLHGGRSMSSLSISLSLCASMVSGVAMIGLPSDTYYYGIQNGLRVIFMTLLAVLISYFFVCPIFYNLQLRSLYTYMELRFNTRVKLLTSVQSAVHMIFLSSIISYVTALTVSQFLEIDIQIINMGLCSVCIAYTVFGGFKGVVWTDVFQMIIILSSASFICIKILREVGDFGKVINAAESSGRLTIDFNLGPTKRDSVLPSFFGGFALVLERFIMNQGIMQRFISLRCYREVKRAHIFLYISFLFIYVVLIFCGLFVLAKYEKCDPFTAQKVKKMDQIIPYTVLDLGKTFPGFSGIFLAGIISGGLSSLSTLFNSLSAIIFMDFVKPLRSDKINENNEAYILKIICCIVGVLSTLFVYVIQHLGSVISALISISPITNCSVYIIFFIAMFIPSINAYGAFWGSLTTMFFTGWLVFGKQWYTLKGMIGYPPLPLNTSGCEEIIPISKNVSPTYAFDKVPYLYRISHNYQALIGILIAIITSVVVSYLTRRKDMQVEDNLLSPLVHYFRKRTINKKQYSSVITNSPENE